MEGFVFVALPDQRARLKGPDISELVKSWLEAVSATASRSVPVVVQSPASAQQAPNSAYMSPDLQQRYGLNRGVDRGIPGSPGTPAPTLGFQQAAAPRQAVQAPQSAEAIAAQIAQLPSATLAEGDWNDENGRYQIALRADKSILVLSPDQSSMAIEAFLREGKLYLRQDQETVVMERL